MADLGVWGYALLATCSIFIAFLSILFAAKLGGAPVLPVAHSPSGKQLSATFLFDGDGLADTNSTNLKDILDPDSDEVTWSSFVTAIRAQIQEFPNSTHSFVDGVVHRFASKDSAINASLVKQGPLTKVILSNWPTKFLQDGSSAQISNDSKAELDTLRHAISGTPYPVWETNDAGKINWANDAYDSLATTLRKPPTDEGRQTIFHLPELLPAETTYRTSIADEEKNASYWFDVSTVCSGANQMHYATDANAVVSAEIAQRNFVQTLTKTFAQLSIGLAIFDRNRQLALFNPALIDLTSLPADFLSARPNLSSFFDRMRDNRMIPEPKDYRSWREQLADLVVAASNGRYCETWTLPSGLTYRVTGRPHPDGAVAFLFEDISAEISLTRRFRAELELTQSVVDLMPDAVVVFSPVGNLTFCNKAYRLMWGVDPESSFADISIRDSLRQWKSQCTDCNEWSRIYDSVVDYDARVNWSTSATMEEYGSVKLSVAPINGDSTIISFQRTPAAIPLPIKSSAL